jgi:hypothetical protein
MAKWNGSRAVSDGRTGHIDGVYSMIAAIVGLPGLFNRISRAGLAERFLRLREGFLKQSSMQEPIFVDRTGIPQRYEEIRDKAALDIQRNIR